MAKFDLSKVENYAAMTAEEKVAFFETYDFPEQQTDNEETRKLKLALSKANTEASEWKKALREKQTEQERAEAERVEREKAVEEELRNLRRDKAVSGYVAQCLALGYDKDLALRAAEAMADGDAASVLACQQDFLENKKKELEAAALGKQPPITPGKPPKGESDDDKLTQTMLKYAGL